MVRSKDYLLGALVGFFTGILAWRIFLFLGIDFAFREVFFFLGIPILWATGVALGGFLGKWMPFFNQFGKFAAVGFLGAAIDFSVLNFVSYKTSITAGLVTGWINVPGFFLAVINNYFWNKLWVFSSGNGDIFSDFGKFFGVTLVGLAINSGSIILLTSFFIGSNAQVWLNISKVAANALAMIWNFTGYKFIAFKKNV